MITNIIGLALLEEMRNYNPKQFKSEKAKRVWTACCVAGKFKLAQKIENKYSYTMKSDLAIAFGFSLMAAKQRKENNEK